MFWAFGTASKQTDSMGYVCMGAEADSNSCSAESPQPRTAQGVGGYEALLVSIHIDWHVGAKMWGPMWGSVAHAPLNHPCRKRTPANSLCLLCCAPSLPSTGCIYTGCGCAFGLCSSLKARCINGNGRLKPVRVQMPIFFYFLLLCLRFSLWRLTIIRLIRGEAGVSPRPQRDGNIGPTPDSA